MSTQKIFSLSDLKSQKVTSTVANPVQVIKAHLQSLLDSGLTLDTIERKQFINDVVALGVNKSTASTQFYNLVTKPLSQGDSDTQATAYRPSIPLKTIADLNGWHAVVNPDEYTGDKPLIAIQLANSIIYVYEL